MMPHQHVAQQFITVGELCTDALAHSPIGTAMLDTVRAIILQVRRMEEMLHQGTAHGGTEMKHALAALHTDVGGLNDRLQALRCVADTLFHDLSEGLTVLCLQISLVMDAAR